MITKQTQYDYDPKYNERARACLFL